LNDFHGNLQTTTTGGIAIDPPTNPRTFKAAGGAAIVASYLREPRPGCTRLSERGGGPCAAAAGSGTIECA
jgi:hypothetical protein